jgi:membrane AbrB-like protein
MIASAAAHLLGLVDGAPPAAAVAAAQLFLGAAVGCRFRGVDLVHMLRAVLASLGLTSVMLLASMGFAAGLHLATGLPLVLVILAYVPGGLAEMSIIAFSLSVDPTFVASHHIARVSLVVMLAPVLFQLYCRVIGQRPPIR